MSVDQIKKFIYRLLQLGLISCLLNGCPQSSWYPPQRSAEAVRTSARELAYEPPLPLKQLAREPFAELKVLASLNSLDRAGHRRIQLYVFFPKPPGQADYWQMIERYRNQYDVIWIYLSSLPQADTSQFEKQGIRAAWFAPGLPKSLHFPGFKARHHHDGLYWNDAP